MSSSPLKVAIEKVGAHFGLPQDKLAWLQEDDQASPLLAIFAELGRQYQWQTPDLRHGLLPKSCNTAYDQLAKMYGLPQDPGNCDTMGLTYYLPLTVQTELFLAGWRVQNVYGEKMDQLDEDSKLRILENYIIVVLGLFHGRVMLKPNTPTFPANSVQNKVFTFGGAILLIAVVREITDLRASITQLYDEMRSTAQANEEAGMADLLIYGLISDLDDNFIYRYDPKAARLFSCEQKLYCGFSRIEFGKYMMNLANKLFTIFLEGYRRALEIKVNKTSAQPSSSHLLAPPGAAHYSEYNWLNALKFVQDAVQELDEWPDGVDSFNSNSAKAVMLLKESALLLPRCGGFSGSTELEHDEKALYKKAEGVGVQLYEDLLEAARLSVEGMNVFVPLQPHGPSRYGTDID